MAQVGEGKFTYEVVENFLKLPAGQSFGLVSRVAVDSQDRVYAFQRKDPPVVVFDRDGNYLNSWGAGVIKNPHGLRIIDDKVYITDLNDSVALIFTLDGKLLQQIGTRGECSDTGCDKSGALVPRAAGPFNYPTELIPGLSDDLYVTDGYRNSRVHRFSRDGRLLKSWGQPGKTAPGDFHLPHGLVVTADGKLYVCDRENRRVQVFTTDGEFISMFATGKRGPNDIALGKDGLFYICEQLAGKEPGDSPGYVQIRDAAGNMLARFGARHTHGIGVDSRGDIYVALTTDRSVDKFIRKS